MLVPLATYFKSNAYFGLKVNVTFWPLLPLLIVALLVPTVQARVVLILTVIVTILEPCN